MFKCTLYKQTKVVWQRKSSWRNYHSSHYLVALIPVAAHTVSVFTEKWPNQHFSHLHIYLSVHSRRAKQKVLPLVLSRVNRDNCPNILCKRPRTEQALMTQMFWNTQTPWAASRAVLAEQKWPQCRTEGTLLLACFRRFSQFFSSPPKHKRIIGFSGVLSAMWK